MTPRERMEHAWPVDTPSEDFAQRVVARALSERAGPRLKLVSPSTVPGIVPRKAFRISRWLFAAVATSAAARVLSLLASAIVTLGLATLLRLWSEPSPESAAEASPTVALPVRTLPSVVLRSPEALLVPEPQARPTRPRAPQKSVLPEVPRLNALSSPVERRVLAAQREVFSAMSRAAAPEGLSGDAPHLLPMPELSGQWLRSLHPSLIPLVATPPLYPPEYRAAGTEGWVLLSYSVSSKGHVTELRVLDAQPPGVFEEAALQAARTWRYQPVVVDGRAVRVPNVWSKVSFTADGRSTLTAEGSTRQKGPSRLWRSPVATPGPNR